MKIAIIGSGNVGGALAKKWAQAGHEIIIGTRDPQNFKGKQLLALTGVSVQETKAAVVTASVILIATPAAATVEVARSLGDTTGKVIIDAMNIVGGKGPESFPSTALALLAHTQTRDVVKCFNTTGFNNIENPVYGGQKLDLFMAGDSTAAKEIARTLALDAGFAECYDVGGNDKFQLMEQFAFFWINLAMMRGHGREIGFKLLKR